jgi:hypothetical protein
MNLTDALNQSITNLYGAEYAAKVMATPTFGPDKVLDEDRDYPALAENKERY